MTTVARDNPLTHPTLRDDELCHVVDPNGPAGGPTHRTLCGLAMTEAFCCGVLQKPCGRPRCPECVMLYRRWTGRGRP